LVVLVTIYPNSWYPCRPDGLQSLSFALCHVYARSTRSVSVSVICYLPIACL
jgi:hypothetical protein